MAFVDLPGELICYVMHHAPAPSTASAASQTCKNAHENLHAFMRELQLKHELDQRIAGCINGNDPMFRQTRMHIRSKLESWAASAVSCKQYLLSRLLLMMMSLLSTASSSGHDSESNDHKRVRDERAEGGGEVRQEAAAQDPATFRRRLRDAQVTATEALAAAIETGERC